MDYNACTTVTTSLVEAPNCWSPEFQQHLTFANNFNVFAENFCVFEDNFHVFAENLRAYADSLKTIVSLLTKKPKLDQTCFLLRHKNLSKIFDHYITIFRFCLSGFDYLDFGSSAIIFKSAMKRIG